MPFYFLKEAASWFKHITGSTEVKFDLYYYCFMAGIAAEEVQVFDNKDTTELVSNWPGPYRQYRGVLMAVLLQKELQRLAIPLSDRAEMHKEIERLLDPLDPAGLSTKGFEMANKYAAGGFHTLSRWFVEPPMHIDTFLPKFKKKISEAIHSKQ